jgi:enoyl-CoA hydratase/3-hydroxyacyl-CoA dehydrogenase
LIDRVEPPADAPIAVAHFGPIEPIAASGQRLSAEIVAILERAILEAAAAPTFAAALEIGYRAFGASACTAAAREGINAFQQRRLPDFASTG